MALDNLIPQEQYGEMPEMQEVPQRDIYLRDIPEVDTGRSVVRARQCVLHRPSGNE